MPWQHPLHRFRSEACLHLHSQCDTYLRPVPLLLTPLRGTGYSLKAIANDHCTTLHHLPSPSPLSNFLPSSPHTTHPSPSKSYPTPTPPPSETRIPNLSHPSAHRRQHSSLASSTGPENFRPLQLGRLQEIKGCASWVSPPL